MHGLLTHFSCLQFNLTFGDTCLANLNLAAITTRFLSFLELCVFRPRGSAVAERISVSAVPA